MTFSHHSLLLLCTSSLVLLLFTFPSRQQFISVSQNFTAAFDAAIQELVSSPTWIQYYSENMFFAVPKCSTKVEWPEKDPFVGRFKIVTCFESATSSPWLETKTKLADSVVAIINNHYKTNYTNELKRYSTIELGFFQTLKNAVATGDCDIVTTQTQPIVERAQFVHFQCGFGLASKGWVRTGKDPQIVIQNVSDLNNNGILVGALTGTAYETFVKSSLTKATLVPLFSVTSQFDAVLNQNVHAIIGDAIQLLSWKKQVGNCNCEVKAFDTSYEYSTFTNGNITYEKNAASFKPNTSVVSLATTNSFGNQYVMPVTLLMMVIMLIQRYKE